MSEELDRLFREKLEDHKLTPNETAWSKVEGSLDNKRKGIVWFRAAAAIVLLCALTIVILVMRSGEETKGVIAKVDSTHVTPKVKVTPAPKRLQKIDEPKLPVVKSTSRRMKAFIAQKSVIKEIEPPLAKQEVSEVIESSPQVTQEVQEVKPTKKPITLTYTLASITSQEENVVAEQKKGLKKLVDETIAKRSESVLADLKMMKDELFALNFKKNNKE